MFQFIFIYDDPQPEYLFAFKIRLLFERQDKICQLLKGFAHSFEYNPLII